MYRQKQDDSLLIDNPLYDSFDEIFFEDGEEIFCIDPNTVFKGQLTEGEIYEVLHYSVSEDMAQIKDDSGNIVWVEVELFVSCDDLEVL